VVASWLQRMKVQAPDNSLGFTSPLPFEQDANDTVRGSNNLLSFHLLLLFTSVLRQGS
jgi:hypothetical protein